MSADSFIFFGMISQGYDDDESCLIPEAAQEELDEAMTWGEVYCKKVGIEASGIIEADEKAEEHSGCTIGDWGWTEEPQHFIAIDKSLLKNDWEQAQEIKPEHFKTGKDWADKLKKFCEVMGFRYVQPKWYTVCASDRG
jgi:hypothetical protein